MPDLTLSDDLYEVKGSFDYTRESDGKKFTYTHWYVAVQGGYVRGAEGYTGSIHLADKTLEEQKEMYDMLCEDKWVEHRKWLESLFECDFTEWVRMTHQDEPKELPCRWHNKEINYEEPLNLALSTDRTVPEALERAQSKVKLTMRAWPDCQGDPLEVGVRFHPQDEKLSFFWNCPRHDTGK